MVDNGFDLEVLDRGALGLAELPPPLDYLNVRILQCHDIWHAVAGYETTGLHEVAISGFQMGQFGHLYSSLFLGVVLTKVAFTQPFEGFGFLLDTILSAYRHGRESPPLLGVDWESIWDRPVDAIRVEARHPALRVALSARAAGGPALGLSPPRSRSHSGEPVRRQPPSQSWLGKKTPSS